MEALGYVDGLAFRDHRLARHGNTRGADEADLCAAQIAADSAPTVTATFEKGSGEYYDGEESVKNDGVDEVAAEIEVCRVCDGGGHVCSIAFGRAP